MKKIWFFITLSLIFSVSFVKAAYIDEYPESYSWAFKNWITTQPTIEKANMYWNITRIELSKMISNYAINVLNKKVDTSKKCQFTDIFDKLDAQYDLWVTKACQLWLMWQWISKFRPGDNVTRAEFWTILSRLLYWTKYDGWKPYYIKHINNLNIRWIMNNTNNAEKLDESRGNVMVMLKRSETLWNISIPSFEELDNVVNDKCPSDFEWSYERVLKKSFIIPYKDWFIGYEFWWQEWRLLYLTYRKLEKPCELISISDAIFWRNGHWFNEPLNIVYKAIWVNDSWSTDEVVKKLNCKDSDREKCIKELNQYIYNLIIWEEEQEYFTQWMNKFKQDIYNNKFTSWEFWNNRWSMCFDRAITKEKNSNITDWDVLEKLRLKRIHECAIEYLKS